MPIILVKDITFSYGDRELLRWDGKFAINDGDRIGIVGVNGSGKSTLMQLLAGKKQPDRGTVTVNSNFSIIEQIADEVSTPLTGVNRSWWSVPDEDRETFSGGEETRMKIAAALEEHAPLLFADEPTSHLDLTGTIQLRKSLQHYPGAVVLISHDRELLDAVCNNILEVEEGKVTAFTGNYSDYQQQKANNLQRAQFEYEQYREEKKRLEQAARHKVEQAHKQKGKPARMSNKEARLGIAKAQNAEAKRIRSANAVLSRLEHMDVKERPILPDPVNFDVNAHVPIASKEILRLESVRVTREQRELFPPLTFTLKPGMKTAVIGPNGCGKSTLLHTIKEGAEGITTAPRASIGFFDQKLEHLVATDTVLQAVSKHSRYSDTQLRNLLARLGFRKDSVFRLIRQLSGGEKVKAALAQLFFGQYNLLLLDEPTNYLDALTREQLETVLAAYPGTLLFATHDMRLVKRVASHTLTYDNGIFRFAEAFPPS
ncbi:ribosomal protection-like ABC-F family protein [Cohnella silvisoli]|uniref:ABC-F type ribosomal protection protein n=1 Tax=Cohnella silvisoli TaxID=2873699 RepID=A0ABV1KYV4_9BACL|nr:ABC-F type ribosomal protection protein [Cohnella silvisoli]MCD9021853.1 ABC-F type ribosomal protection protein [Cohnella silvisoli]